MKILLILATLTATSGIAQAVCTQEDINADACPGQLQPWQVSQYATTQEIYIDTEGVSCYAIDRWATQCLAVAYCGGVDVVIACIQDYPGVEPICTIWAE